MNKRIMLAATLSWLGASQAHAALSAGDIAFSAFNADEDGYAIVALKAIDANTTIFFTDNEFDGLGGFNTGEGKHTWNTGAAMIDAGTVIRFGKVDSIGSQTVTFGTLALSGDTGLNATAETIYAYLGTDVDTPTTFLAAISTGGFSVANGQLTGTGLTAGVHAVSLTASTDYAEYIGARAGEASFAAYAALVNDPANWSVIVGGDNAAAVPNTGSFSVVPVPAALPLLMSGAGLLGVALRRRVA
ncbi:MAG: hypothetical protein AB7Q01_15430 [Gammaproteobacteria bacterium]